jgi:hypothetical protein
MNADDPTSGATFTSEGYLDTDSPQERLRPAQATSERARIFGVVGSPPRNAMTAAICAGSQKVGGASGPRAAVSHDLPYVSGHRISVDDALDAGSAVCRIGAREDAGRPKGWFASRSLNREIGHSRQVVEVNATHPAQAMNHRIEQSAEDAGPRDFEFAP